MDVPYRLRNDLYCVGWGVKLYSIQSWMCETVLISHRKRIKYYMNVHEYFSVVKIVLYQSGWCLATGRRLAGK